MARFARIRTSHYLSCLCRFAQSRHVTYLAWHIVCSGFSFEFNWAVRILLDDSSNVPDASKYGKSNEHVEVPCWG